MTKLDFYNKLIVKLGKIQNGDMSLQDYISEVSNKIDLLQKVSFKPKVYISGQITGLSFKEAFVLFEKAEKELIERGYEVINPMKLHDSYDKTWVQYMKTDIKELCDCNSIYMLKNWNQSKGAKIELEIATLLELTVIFESQD